MSPRQRFDAGFLAVLALLSAAVYAEEAAPSSPTPQQVDEVFAEWDSTRTPGCSLGVYRDGKMAYARGYGMANLEYGIANSPRTVFRIGSTSKQLTAMAIAVLAEAGNVGRVDPMSLARQVAELYLAGVMEAETEAGPDRAGAALSRRLPGPGPGAPFRARRRGRRRGAQDRRGPRPQPAERAPVGRFAVLGDCTGAFRPPIAYARPGLGVEAGGARRRNQWY